MLDRINIMDQRSLIHSETKETSELGGRFWIESKKIWGIGFPASLARVTQFGMFVVTQSFIGHIGKVELAAYALVQILAIRFAHGLLLGMTSATDTLCGQAFGAKQYHMMGVYLQRSLLINLGTATILLPIFVFAGKIFIVLGQDASIANVAGYLSLWFIPIMYFLALHVTIQKYLQAQLKNMIIGWLFAISFGIHVLLSWIFVSKLNMGIPGAMAAMILSNWFVLIGECVYVFGGWCPHTWKGFTWSAFSDLLPVLRLSISSGVMLCLEFWYNSTLVLIAGYMKNAATEISAFSICLNIAGWDFMLCVGLLSAVSVRVGNELGAGNTKAALFSMKVTLTTSIAIGVFFWILCLVVGHNIAYLFTTEEEVVNVVSTLYVLLAFSVLLNSVQPILTGKKSGQWFPFTGIAVGSGRQAMVALVNIGSYYVLGVPTGLLLGYVANLKVQGIWIGMIIGVVIQTLVLGYITFRTDWDEQVRRASARLNQWDLRPPKDSDRLQLS
ncbi:hypothetical protein Tsubulata_004754 [Turnera subulata]|uniref:Protein DETOXIFICATION n=1 Tax=Turnera subulata TaxID=218843 RepID=A0A9Q0FHQ4_9ROSI|nr:hypothetical protein Tsubulata_004754 [Turnera subulata]